MGNLTTPSGEKYRGFKVSIGGSMTDPAEIKKTYDDIEAIFKSNETKFKTYEEHDSNGHFKKYVVET